jgi:hypothetical protein
MKLGDAFPGKWMTFSDLHDQDCVVTITNVETQMVGQGQDAQLKLVATFKEFDKPLVLNKTNATVIAKVLGSDDTDDWINKRVTLWPNHDVQFGNEIVSAIRVRSRAPQGNGKPTSQAAPASANGLLKFADAVALCATVGIGEQDLKNWLKKEGFTSYNSAACTPKVRELVANLEPVEQISDANEEDIPW